MEPRCGKCAYRVHGLPTTICPECGSDLRAVGISTGPGFRFLTLKEMAVVWTLLIVSVAFVFDPIVAMLYVPAPSAIQDHLNLIPRSQAYGAIMVDARELDRNKVALYLMNPPRFDRYMTRMRINVKRLAFSTEDQDEATGEVCKQLDRDGFLGWMRQNGIETATQSVQVEAGELFDFIRALSLGRGLADAHMQLPSFQIRPVVLQKRPGSVRPPGALVVEVVICFVVWTFGLWMIGRGGLAERRLFGSHASGRRERA